MILADTLPDPLNHSQLFVSADLAPTTITDKIITWNLGTVQPYEEGTIILTLRPTKVGYFTNQVNIVSQGTVDRDLSNNDGSTEYEVVSIMEPFLTAPSLGAWDYSDTLTTGSNPFFEGFAQAGSQVLLYFIPSEGCIDSFSNCVNLNDYGASTITGQDRRWIINPKPLMQDAGTYYVYFAAKRLTDGELSTTMRSSWVPLIVRIDPSIDSAGIDVANFRMRQGNILYQPGYLGAYVGISRDIEPIVITVRQIVPDTVLVDTTLWENYSLDLVLSSDGIITEEIIYPSEMRIVGKEQQRTSRFRSPGFQSVDIEYRPPLPKFLGPGQEGRSFPQFGVHYKAPRKPDDPECWFNCFISRLLFRGAVDPAGYVYDPILARGKYDCPMIPPIPSLISSASVTALTRINDTLWVRWPAENYNQVNPQVTDPATEDSVKQAGYYSFLVTPGQYRVVASAPGYLGYTSPILTVVNEPAYHNVGMRRAPGSGQTTGVVRWPDPKTTPATSQLFQNYPNPFNPTSVIRYQLAVASNVRLAVYDVLGREVAVLVNERKAPGRHEIQFDATGLASGVYFYRLEAHYTNGGQAGSFIQSRKLLLLK